MSFCPRTMALAVLQVLDQMESAASFGRVLDPVQAELYDLINDHAADLYAILGKCEYRRSMVGQCLIPDDTARGDLLMRNGALLTIRGFYAYIEYLQAESW